MSFFASEVKQRQAAVGAARTPRQQRSPAPDTATAPKSGCACGAPGASTDPCPACRKVLEAPSAMSAERAGVAQTFGLGVARVLLDSEPHAAPPAVDDVLSSPGKPLDASVRRSLEPRLGVNLGAVRVHTDEAAADSAMALNARAYAAGPHLVFGPDQYAPNDTEGQQLLFHELTHAIQQGVGRHDRGGAFSSRRLVNDTHLERGAHESARSLGAGGWGAVRPVSVVAGAAGIMRNVAEKVLKFSAKWLAKRGGKFVSKHIATHTRMIAGKAVHSVFKTPRKIKPLLEKALSEATALAAKHKAAPVTQALEEAGVKVMAQPMGGGKVRWLVQKVFPDAIGTAGERILRIVIDQSGRIVTAFPADRLLAIGLGTAALEAFTERTAQAGELLQSNLESSARRAEEDSGLSWVDFVPLIGDVFGGSLNEGETEMLEREDMIRKGVSELIMEIEFEEKRTLGPEKRQELEDLFRAAVGAPILAEHDETGP